MSRSFAVVTLIILGVATSSAGTASAQSVWVERQQLVSPTPPTVDGDDASGGLVGMSAGGEVVVLGGPFEHHGGWRRGAVHIFRRNAGGMLSLEATIPGTVDGVSMGGTVKVSGNGNVILAGQPGADYSGGMTWAVFRHGAGGWTKDVNDARCSAYRAMAIDHTGSVIACGAIGGVGLKALPAVPAPGPPYDPHPLLDFLPIASPGASSSRVSAIAMSSDANAIVAGVPDSDGGPGPPMGAAFLLRRAGLARYQTKLVASDRFYGDSFGYGVAISADGSVIVVSSKRSLSAQRHGQLYAFNAPSGGWAPIDQTSETARIPPPPVESFSFLGAWIGVGEGRTQIATSWSNRGAWIFEWVSSAWQLITPPAFCQYESGIPPLITPDGRNLVMVAPACANLGFPGGVARVYRGLDTPSIIWPTPSQISYGVPLTETQLNATATVPGSFTYSPPLGTVLPVGSHTLRVTFTPADPDSSVLVERSTSISVGPPEPPSNLTVVAVNGSIVSLEWRSPPGVVLPTSYILEAGAEPGQALASVPTGSSSTTFTVAAPTGAFYVRVRAILGPLRSAPSNEVRVFVNVPSPPSSPTNLLGLSNGSFLALSWKNDGAASSSAVRLDVTGTLNATLVLPPEERFTFPSVPPGTFTFTVTAVNGSGASLPSNPVTLTFPFACTGPPERPSALSAGQNGRLVHVSWDPPLVGPAVTGYLLSVAGDYVGAIPMSDRSLSGAVAPGTYIIRVGSTNPCGTSDMTAPVTVVVP
jgi:hypothetical protein